MSFLSERAKALIAKARIVSFADWKSSYSEAAIAHFQAADDERRYLTDADLAAIAAIYPYLKPGLAIAKALRDRATTVVDQARAEVLRTHPGITDAGGDLYPAERADACWRDFWHFLRCITYGIAGCQTQYTSPEGLEAMRLLYQELQVPLAAMVTGLEAIQTASLEVLESSEPEVLTPYFQHLITRLRQF